MCNERGYRTRSGKTFYINTLTNILQNKMYIGDYTYKGEIKRTCPAIIDEATFEKCKSRIEENKIVRGKKIVDNVEYLLSGKLFCGHCGAKMTGDSANAPNGNKHYYYVCHNRKKYHQCNKKREKKDFIEWYVCEQTVEYVLTDERIEYIAGKVVEEYDKEFCSDSIQELEKRLSRIDTELNELVDIMLKTKSETMINKINQKAELLELQKFDTTEELAKLKLCCDVRITIPEVVAWLKGFCKGDLMDAEFRRRIIDVLVSCVYLYDDKVVIYYNVRDGQQVSYMEMLDETADMFPGCEDSECSDSSQLGEPII